MENWRVAHPKPCFRFEVASGSRNPLKFKAAGIDVSSVRFMFRRTLAAAASLPINLDQLMTAPVGVFATGKISLRNTVQQFALERQALLALFREALNAGKN